MTKKKEPKVSGEIGKKIAVTTTFPNWALDVYAKNFVESFDKYFPEDINFLVNLDNDPGINKTVETINPILKKRFENNTIFGNQDFSEEQKKFLERHKNIKPQNDYRLQYVRFSFKIFALEQSLALAEHMGYDYLIWMDADIVINKQITHETLDQWLPHGDELVSYLGRKDWDHSECGFMAFNLKVGGGQIIKDVYQKYVTDEVLNLSQWHDSYVFDQVWKDLKKKNISEGVGGRDVFPNSVLGEYMTHYKGNKKFRSISDIPELSFKKQDGLFGSTVYDVANLPIKTKNCIDHDIIKHNITENLRQIRHWIKPCLKNDEEIVIVNAGPSMNPHEIRPYYDRGVKIVAVKHAMDRLINAGIKPWMCILLDPREHVKNFVKEASPETIFCVASMVNPEVVKTLRERKCMIIGYHALVHAGEEKIVPQGDFLVPGGSATCTRGINVLYNLGFRKMHLFGYDIQSFEKPDLTEKKENGRTVWEEITISQKTYGDLELKKTIWTKGEFLAQAQEFKVMYMPLDSLELHTYGDGLIPWIHKHQLLHQKWEKEKREKAEADLFKHSVNVNELVDDYRKHTPG